MAGPLSFSSALEVNKRQSRVLILGAYRVRPEHSPKGDICNQRLLRLQSYLINKGFINTKLVRDFPDETSVPDEAFDIHFLKKSQYYIRTWADILLFVFFIEGDNKSVIREIGYMADMVPLKCNRSVIVRDIQENLGIVRGDIKGKRMLEYTFENEDELQSYSFAGCFSIIYDM
jgi:hypothetical protein